MLRELRRELFWEAVGEVGGEWKGRAPMSPVLRRAETAGWGAGVVFGGGGGGGRCRCSPMGGAGGKPAEGCVGA